MNQRFTVYRLSIRGFFVTDISGFAAVLSLFLIKELVDRAYTVWTDKLPGVDQVLARWIYGGIFRSQEELYMLAVRIQSHHTSHRLAQILVREMEEVSEQLAVNYERLRAFVHERNLLRVWGEAILLASTSEWSVQRSE